MSAPAAPTVQVPADLCERILARERENSRYVRPGEDTTEEARANLFDYGYPFEMVRPYLDRLDRPKILELGSGNGLGLCDLLLRGLDAVGVEPGEEPFAGRHAFAREILRANGLDEGRIHDATAERLPFPDGHFDVVLSMAVLEHVGDPAAALDETLRVLRPGGLALMHVPNYDSFWEGHYAIPWLPYALREKRAARRYVRAVFRRDPAYLDTLHFLTPAWFTRWGASRGVEVRVYPFLFGLLRKVSATYRVLSEDTPTDHGVVEWLRGRGRLGPVVRAGTGALTRVGAAAGLAPKLTAVFTKP